MLYHQISLPLYIFTHWHIYPTNPILENTQPSPAQPNRTPAHRTPPPTGFVYDPMDSFAFFRTDGAGAYGSRTNITLQQCMVACQDAPDCEG